jgi:hypothetical protein
MVSVEQLIFFVQNRRVLSLNSGVAGSFERQTDT